MKLKECEVLIRFDLSKIPLEDVFAIEDILSRNGIGFDRGAGCGARDWEFDYSLSGPVKVYFKRFVAND